MEQSTINTEKTGATSITASAPKDTLVPVKINIDANILTINNHRYQFQVINNTKDSLAQGVNFLINLKSQPINGQINSAIKQLLVFGDAVELTLPKELIKLTAKNGISTSQLMLLAERAQGYPLPLAKATNNILQFVNGIKLTLPNNFTQNGEFKVSIVKGNDGSLMLRMVPVINKLNLSLVGIAPAKASNVVIPDIVKTKVDIGILYSKLLKTQIKNSGENNDSSTLFKVLNKVAPSLSNDKEMKVLLNQKIPALTPSPLTELANPAKLKFELFSMAQFNPSQTVQVTSPFITHAGAVGGLFQLLLGARFSSKSPELDEYLDLMLNQNKLSKAQTGALERSSFEGVTNLLNNISLYQQANMDPSSNAWFFALPYFFNQKSEQLEGKFEKDKEGKDEKDNGWKLQLKFNLNLGGLLIRAQMKDSNLSLTFSGNNQKLLDTAISNFNILKSNLNHLGFNITDIVTKLEQVPATLLPGDHYLVKIKV